MKPDVDALGSRIRLTRVANGMRQSELAELLGMKSAQLSRYESGKHFPRDRILDEIAAALNVRSEWLAKGVGPRHVTPEDGQKKPLTVTTAPLHEGGTEVTFVLYDELRSLFMERAEREGLTLESFLRNALLDLAKERGEDRQKAKLAERVAALIEAGVV